MPWEIKKSSDCPADKPWGVFNKLTGRKVACHATENSAKAQQRALYANVEMSELSENYISSVQFAEIASDGLLWLEALPAKSWKTIQYGEVSVTIDDLKEMIDNFKNNVRGQEIATDYDHMLDPAKGNKASGWFRDFKIQDGSLYAGIEPTPTALSEIKNKEWKYFSLEWDRVWKHPETEKTHSNVICGGGFTNRPIAKGLVPINFSELYIEKGGKMGVVENEHAAEEHTEPGESDNPDSKTNPGDESKPDRHVTLPADSDKVDEEGRPVTNTTEDDEVELDKQLREKLGLDKDADIVKAVSDLKEEVGPLHEVAKKFSEKKSFAEQYPEQHAELERLRKERIEGESIRFSENYGKKRVAGDKGLSGLALQKLQESHIKLSEGTMTTKDFEEFLEVIVDEKGLVDFDERGSGKHEHVELREGANPRMQFSEVVNRIMKEDELSYEKAVKVAAEKHPDLAEAYGKPVRA